MERGFHSTSLDLFRRGSTTRLFWRSVPAMACGSSLSWWAGMSVCEDQLSSHSQDFGTRTWWCLSNNKYYHLLLQSICHVEGTKSFTLMNEFNLNNPKEAGIIIIP